MEQHNFKTPFKATLEDIKKYLELKLEYNKVVTRKKMGEVAGHLALFMMLFGIFVIIILFLSLAFVNWYADQIGTRVNGFLIVTLGYLFIALILFAFKESLIFSPLRKFLAKTFSSMDEKDFFGGRTYSDTRSAEKYIGFLEKQNRKQEHILQDQLRGLENHLNWVNITKNAFSTFLQSVSTARTLIKTAYKFGKRFSPKGKKKLRDNN